MTEPHEMRISDVDRERVADLLRTSAGEGRLDLDELEERLEATWAAKTFADLWPLTRDLPGGSTGQPPVAPGRAAPSRAPSFTGAPGVPGGASLRLSAMMSGVERKGDWVVPAALTASAVMGGIDLDLREAELTARETVMTLNVVMGGAEITVGPEVEVIVEGTGIMGGFSGPSGRVPAELHADSPVLRVRGFAIMGGVSVHRKRPRGELRRRILGS